MGAQSQSHSKSKQIPFNVSLPWGQSAAAYLGISLDELKANYKNDHRLHDEIQSACSMIRDYSIRELTASNGSAAKTLKDICYGTGYTLVEGHMVQSGACRQGTKTPKPFPLNKDSTDTAGYTGACLKKEGDIFVNYDRRRTNPFVAKTWPERVEDKDMIGTFSHGKSAAFVQTGSTINSNLEIPGYSDPTLNGKGYSFNSLPHERYDDSSDQFLYKSNAYNIGQHSIQPASKTQQGLELAKKLQEENKAIGTDLGEDSMVRTDMRYYYVRLDNLPDWVCTTICAGLNMDDIVSGELDTPMDFNEVEGNLFKTEEEYQIHMGRKGQDKRLDRPTETLGMYKQYNGEYLCENIPPSIDDCIEKGLELSTWFTERILNPLVMCNWKKNDCGSLFGSSPAGGAKDEAEAKDNKPEADKPAEY